MSGVDFEEGEIRGEEFGDDLFAFDDEEAEGFAMFFFAEGAEALDVGFGQHANARSVGDGRRGASLVSEDRVRKEVGGRGGGRLRWEEGKALWRAIWRNE